MEERIYQLLEQADEFKFAGKHKRAIALCEEILLEDAACVEALEEIGDNYISLHNFAKAEKALLRALKLNPHSANACYLLGFLYSCRRDWEASVSYLEKADSLKPNHPEILRCLGWSYALGGERGKGIILLERARTLAPEDAYILTDLGVCYLNERNIAKALPIFRRVLEIDPHNEKARECLVIVEEYAASKKKLSEK